MLVHNTNNLPTIKIIDLVPTQGNLKDLTEKNYNKLKKVIEKRGFSYPVYIWEDENGIKHLLDGHQRQRVLKKEGWNEPIPYLKIPANNIKEAMERLLEITSQYATITQEGIDEYIAKYELNEAEVYEATAFDANIGKYDEEKPEVEEDEAPEVDESEPPKSKLGEIYQLGRHRVMCGDSTKGDNYIKLMNDIKADLLHTDPPYGIDYEGGSKKREKIANDAIPVLEFYTKFLSLCRLHCKDGASAYVWHAPSETHNAINAFIDAGWQYKQYIIWNKNNSTFGRQDYHWKHEPAIYGWGQGSHSWHGDRKQTTVWDIERPTTALEHPTMKPIALCCKGILNSTKSEDIVLDVFGGSGSILIACEQTDRICYMMELDPKYVDVIRKRYAKFIQPDDQLPENWEELTPVIERGLSDGKS
jgi:DNA modification methylase